MDEITDLLKTPGNMQRNLAVGIANAHQIVTPVSGAVVLENQRQYDEAGLEQGDIADSPMITPEPETWALLIAGVLVFSCTAFFKKRFQAA